MYIRMTFFKSKEGKMDNLRWDYNDKVLPLHKGHKGVRFVHLLESLDASNGGISVTAWDTKSDMENYEKSGDYENLLSLFKDYFDGDPTRKSYEVAASSEPLLLRIF